VRILIVTNHFWPENFRITDLAVGLQERGHEVTAFTGIPDYPAGRFYEGYGLFKKRTEIYHGVRIVRFPLIPRGNGRALRLALNYLSSVLLSCVHIPFVCRDNYDAIFVFDTSPITIGLPAILLKRLKSIPLVFWVLDLWPESLIATGAVKSPQILKLVKRLVRFIYGQCDRLLISSKGFTANLSEIGGYEGEVTYFPNWVEPEYLQQGPANLEILPALPSGFKIMFAGNIGAAQDFPTILAAAEKLKGYSDIQWVILGDGRQMEWVKNEVKSRDLSNSFHLLGRFPPEMMSAFFAQADAMLLPLRDDPIFALTVPGKLQSYLACGKPVIAALNGEGARLVEEAEAGLSCAAESPDALAEQVLALYQMPIEVRRMMGKKGQTFCFEHFERAKLFTQVEKIIAEVAGCSLDVDPEAEIEKN
jgi:glycosyltransferase involved in cell wall biosynthesis